MIQCSTMVSIVKIPVVQQQIAIPTKTVGAPIPASARPKDLDDLEHLP